MYSFSKSITWCWRLLYQHVHNVVLPAFICTNINYNIIGRLPYIFQHLLPSLININHYNNMHTCTNVFILVF
jgi:hypothetical protein